MNPRGIDHIHFTVTDIEKPIKFFRALGLLVAERMDHGGETVQMFSEDGGLAVNLGIANYRQTGVQPLCDQGQRYRWRLRRTSGQGISRRWTGLCSGHQ